MDARELQMHEGKRLRLEFRDGQVVKARLIHVDPGPPAEIIYDRVEVLEAGPAPLPRLEPQSGVTAKLEELTRYELVS